MRRTMLASILVFLLSGVVSANDLSEALDTSLSFTTGGSADWFGQSATSYYDGDAAQSGDISDTEDSWMRTTVGGAGTVSFYWKVSSEGYCDFLEFYIDGLIQDRISGSADWEQMTYTLPPGSHTLEWRYMKDYSMYFGSDCGWVDQIEWVTGSQPPPPPPSCDLSDALNTSLSFTTGGSADWFCQSAMFYYDGLAAQSGDILHNQDSWMQTTISGPTMVSFCWKVFSESGYDYLAFYIDDVLQDSISGSMDWQQMMYTLPSGPHTLAWRYVKDGSVSSGSDCGWVDLVEWGTDPQPPPPTCDLSEALDTTLSFITGGDADWFCQSETAYYDGDAAQSGDISHDGESWMQMMVSGPTTLSFYWKVSSESGCDFLEFYIDGLLGHSISGSSMDWQQKMYTLPLGSHTLEWRYVKDWSDSTGSDCGWVDQVELGNGQPPSPDELSEALDTTLIFLTGGEADWFAQSSTFHYDGDAAQSGVILHDEETWVETTVSGAGTFSFYWKVSSESDYDYLEFYIDGSVYDSISGLVDWQQMTYTLPSGSHTLEWRYFKDGSISSGSDCGWVDMVEWVASSQPPPGDLSEALDTSLSLTTGGDAYWFSQSSTFYYDGDAAQSGDISHNRNSWLQTTVSGAGTVSFYWKVSSEVDCDFLEFYINGLFQDRISGSVDWYEMTYALPSGSHALEWRYSKDSSMNSGSDCGWVDQVVWVTGSQPPPPPGDLSEALDTSLSLTTGGSADWFCQSAMSHYDGDAAQSGDVSHNQLSWMRTTVSGPVTASFYWKVSSEGGFDCLEFYIGDVLQDSISGSMDWQQMIYTIPSGSHTLAWRYFKDGSVSSGSDCGWVDHVVLGNGQPPPSCDLSEALDTTLSFTSRGDGDWFCESATSFYGGDAAHSGVISHNQESWMQTTVSGPTTLSFYWKVSSEVGYDFLECYIDGLLGHSISGPVDWQQKVYIIPLGLHTLEWRYFKDGSVSSGSDCGWVDHVVLGTDQPPPPPGELSEALDTTLSLITGGEADWFFQSSTFYYDGDAAQSGDISHEEESWMQTTVSGAETVSFYWKISSEVDCDFLEFYIDGVPQNSISGSVDWQQMMYTLDSGSHTLEWRYVKDWSDIFGSDCGWVDQVELVTDQPPPSCDLSEALDTSLSFTTGGGADWFGQATAFYYDGDAAQSGDISHNQDSWLQTTVSGPVTVSFYWRVSSEGDYDFLEFYIDGSLQNRISGSLGWHEMVYPLTSGSHTLEWRYIKDHSVHSGSDCGWVDFIDVN